MGKSSPAGKQGWARLFPQSNKSRQGSGAPQVPPAAPQSSNPCTTNGSKENPKSKLFTTPSWLQPKTSKPAPAPACKPAQKPSLTTDKRDYSTGELVRITASGVTPGATVRFSLADDPNQSGLDGNADDYGSFLVRDGGPGDLDPRKGVVATNWRVPTDNNGTGMGTPDALGATVRITAQEVLSGKDCKWGTADDVVKGPLLCTTITDASSPVTTPSLSLSPVPDVAVSLDETKGLQNQTTTPTPAGDADDNEILSRCCPHRSAHV